MTATFSEAMTATTITGTTVVLQAGTSTVAATVAYNATTRTATLTPTAALAAATTYTATVLGGASGVKDLAGNALATTFTWTFTTGTAPDTTPPTVTGVTPAAGATNVAPSTVVTATFSEAMTATTITGTTVVLQAGTSTVAATVAYNATTRTATLTPTAALASATTYTATVLGGASGVKDLAGNALATTFTWTFTTGGSGGGLSCPCSIWSPTATPAARDPEVAALEVGVKFQSEVNGYITGIRFYKYAQNTGPHVGSLWTASGTQLGSVTFTNETASGWQQATFATPIAITANTTYVASYHMNAGSYGVTEPGFTTAVDTPPLHALASGASGGNGVYRASATSVFPNQTYNASNYWVDVVFTTTVAADTTPPTVTGVTPAAGATNVAPSTVVTATFSEAMTATTITGTTVVLQAGTSTVAATVAYNATTRTATLTPTAALAAATTYTATVLGGASGVKDLAGNALATTFTWTFTTGTSPSLGQWSSVLSWPLVAINATLLRTGEVLLWDGGTSVGDAPTHGGLSAQLWNPQTQAFVSVPTSRTDLFCSSSCVLPDGRIFVGGGSDPNNNSVGISHANVFNPTTRQWSSARSMANRRWYPTATCLPDGRVLMTSGSQFSDFDWIFVPEVYNPVSNTWTQLSNAAAPVPYYPHVFVLPDGRILNASTFQQPYASDILNVQNQTRTLVDNLLLDGGSAVMYLPGKILKSGTATFNNGSTEASGATAYVLDMTAPVPTWRQTNSMHFPRSYHTLTVLPNGTVLVTGGGMTKDSTDVANAVYEAEIWSPQTETWTTVSRMQRPRLYHSTALLLPDGRVLVAGGGRNFRSNLKELNAEIYSPPYLFNGPRPTITAVPSSVTYGSNVTVQTPARPR